MKRIQLIIADADQTDVKSWSNNGISTATNPGQTYENGVLKIESVVSDAHSDSVVRSVLRELNDCAMKVHATDLISSELHKAGPEANTVYFDVISLVERELIKKVLEECQGVQTKAASRLGINRNTLHKKMQHLGLTDYPETPIERSIPE